MCLQRGTATAHRLALGDAAVSPFVRLHAHSSKRCYLGLVVSVVVRKEIHNGKGEEIDETQWKGAWAYS